MLDFEEGPAAVADEELQGELRDISANVRLSEQYLALARDLDVMEPKAPDEARAGLLAKTLYPTLPYLSKPCMRVAPVARALESAGTCAPGGAGGAAPPRSGSLCRRRAVASRRCWTAS